MSAIRAYFRALLFDWCWSVEAYTSNLDQLDGRP